MPLWWMMLLSTLSYQRTKLTGERRDPGRGGDEYHVTARSMLPVAIITIK
jgi:hypothetical protein